MDTSGFCQVGRHGTLSLLKRQVGDADGSILTSFGIDDDELTVGSSTTCSVRLYYPDVDSLHCKIVFDQFKAFLAILGSSGLIVDGCQVYPHTSGETSGSVPQTIIPLNNDSIFEIHGKRFKFNYPPKELRKALYATLARPPQRALRLSMIHSAQVFSPRPSNDPRENLRILQSPVKKPSSPIKHSSPLKCTILPEIEEEEIVLVHTNYPRVVEEEKDLVILEDVPVRLLSPTKATLQQANPFPLIQAQQQAPSTPRRRSLGGTALHRAVLIRSAQRAVQKAEKEREEEEEELEVFGAVVSNDGGDGELAVRITEPEPEDVDMFDVDEDEKTDEEDEDGDPETQTQKSLWRKSFETIIPWSLSGSDEGKDRQEDKGYGPTINKIDDRKEEPVEVLPPAKSSGKGLGPFMTPQTRHLSRTLDFKGVQGAAPAPRFSLGGQPRRIIVEQPWKVHDLVLPPIASSNGTSQPLMPMDPPAPTALSFEGPSIPTTPLKPTLYRAETPANGNPITEEEKRAIQERRRSAVKEFGSTQVWAGGAPGMSPTKGSLDRSNMFSPNKQTGAVSPSKKPIYGSPMKARFSDRPIAETGDTARNADEDLDTSGLLDKIKETVNDMKRRRSIVLGGSSVIGTPQSSTFASEDLSVPAVTPADVNVTPEESSMRKVDFTKISTPLKAATKHLPLPKTPQKDSANNEEGTNIVHEEKPFSLLRPGALEGRRQSIVSTPVRKERIVAVVPVPLITVDQVPTGDSEQEPKETVIRGRSRALRSGNSTAERNESCPDTGMEDNGGKSKLKAAKTDNAKQPSVRRQRSKTPQPPTLAVAASDASSEDVSQRATRSAASGKVTVVDTPLKQIPEETDNIEKPTTRRLRKAPTVAKTEDEVKPIQAAPKRGRPRKNAPRMETSQAEEGPRLAGKPTSKARSGVKRKTPTIREVDSEDDPLDSYEIESVPHSSSTEDDKDISDSVPNTISKSKIKTPVAVTRANASTRIKQEEPVEDSALPIATTRGGRRAASQIPDATPAVKPATGRTRGRPKTPATAPANTGASVTEEKENTIGSRSSKSKTEKVSNTESEEMPVKLRVSRSRAASRAAKAAEEDDEQAPPTRQRATRIMRTRTKTG